MRRKRDNSTESEDYEKHVLPHVLARSKLGDKPNRVDTLTLDEVTEDLLHMEPAKWRDQDHYRVLGLSELRFKATPEQIKKAHQLRALQFHPDKITKTSSSSERSDSFFKCVQRAYEVLRDPIKRRQYDS
ncbi:Zuotin, partial [Coemansia aciculifera]